MTISRHSFFGLLGASSLAMPAMVRAVAEPVTAGATAMPLDRAIASAHGTWQDVVAQIRAEEAVTAGLHFDQIMALAPPTPRYYSRPTLQSAQEAPCEPDEQLPSLPARPEGEDNLSNKPPLPGAST